MPTDFDIFESELLAKPGVKKEFDSLNPKYTVIRDLIQRRNELNLSQRDLAKMVGTRQPAISRLEAGDRNTRIETLVKVADALGLKFALIPKKSTPRTTRKSTVAHIRLRRGLRQAAQGDISKVDVSAL